MASNFHSFERRSANHPVDVERVLQTASTLFATFGYEGVGTREIARGSGCHVPSLYYHFRSKDDLYRATFDDRCAGLVGSVKLSVASAEDPEARLSAYVCALFECFTADRELLLLLMRDLINASVARPRYLFGVGHLQLKEMLETLIRDLSGRSADEHRVFAIMSLIFGFCCGLPLTDQSVESLTQSRQQLVDTVQRMLDAHDLGTASGPASNPPLRRA